MTLAGPFSIKHSRDLVFCRNLVAPEVRSGSYSIATAIVFSFGILVIEVRHMCLATYSVGEMDDLSSA